MIFISKASHFISVDVFFESTSLNGFRIKELKSDSVWSCRRFNEATSSQGFNKRLL